MTKIFLIFFIIPVAWTTKISNAVPSCYNNYVDVLQIDISRDIIRLENIHIKINCNQFHTINNNTLNENRSDTY